MAITGKMRSAKGSRVSANGVNLNLAEYEVEDKGDDLDTTNFESGGFEQGLIGIEVCDLSFKGLWDAGRNYLDSPPGIFPTDTYPNLRLYPSVADNTFWLFPFARLLSCRNGASVRDKVTFEASGKSNGSFQRPTGSV